MGTEGAVLNLMSRVLIGILGKDTHGVVVTRDRRWWSLPFRYHSMQIKPLLCGISFLFMAKLNVQQSSGIAAEPEQTILIRVRLLPSYSLRQQVKKDVGSAICRSS